MKKLLALLLVIVMTLSLASCSFFTFDGFDVDAGESDGKTDNKPSTGNKYKYTDFSSAEKKIFSDYIGEIIPFIPTNEYTVEGYYEESDYENGINFYTVGNTKVDFENFRASLDGYVLSATFDDNSGDTWYEYQKGDVILRVSYYHYEGKNFIDVYLSVNEGDNSSGGGNQSGNDNTDNGNSGGNTGSGSVADGDAITNNGKGLPSSANGVYNVDFTGATKVKDVTDLGYYIDGCPTTGSPAVLVIPVDFSDVKASDLGFSTDVIAQSFIENGENDYYSVYDYYYISSYGQLSLDITVLDYWFRPSNSSSYYENLTDSDGSPIGDYVIIDEALKYLEPRMDLSDFDSDGNGLIDSIVLINTLDVNSDSDFHWAYRYWNFYATDDGYYYEYDGVSANDYLWASYKFLFEEYPEDGGDAIYTDTSRRNTYTFIHEFAHVLGATDYYDTAYVAHPMDGADMMDAMTGDHNPYTKFNYGWLTTSRLVVADGSITLTLEAFEKSGDTIMIANNFDPTLGVYQEYYILMYYKNTGLNEGEEYGYFARDGVVVYHVNASLCKEAQDGTDWYYLYNSNTDPSGEDGSVDNLIEFVKSAEDNFTYVVGDTLPTVTDDNGDALCYNFTVDALTSDYATITFTKR